MTLASHRRSRDTPRRARPAGARRPAARASTFNVSHTRGVALMAIARDVPPTTRIGVDIEHGEREVGVDMLQKKFLAPDERERIAGFHRLAPAAVSCTTGRARRR
jgi:phosphopantetheinyl transferase